MKKKIIIFLTILFLIIGWYNIYKFKVRNDFKNYLTEKYQEREFKLTKVSYSPTLQFHALFKFSNEELYFTIYFRTGGKISDDYPKYGTVLID